MIVSIVLAAFLPALGATPDATGIPTAGEDRRLADEEVRAIVDSYLGAIDRPVPPESWRALGPAAVPHLEATLRSDDLPTRRAAAVTALAAIGGERARALVVATAGAERERFVVRSAALRGAPQVVGRAELLGALQPALETARSPRVRAVAAEVLAGAGGADGCGAVKAQARRETASRERFAKALARCGPAP